MIRRPPRSTRTEHTLSLHYALPISFDPKIGYPKKWKDYSALVVKPDDLVGNAMRSAAVGHARQTAKLGGPIDHDEWDRSEEHTSELQSLMRISYAVFCLKKKIKNKTKH